MPLFACEGFAPLFVRAGEGLTTPGLRAAPSFLELVPPFAPDAPGCVLCAISLIGLGFRRFGVEKVLKHLAELEHLGQGLKRLGGFLLPVILLRNWDNSCLWLIYFL